MSDLELHDVPSAVDAVDWHLSVVGRVDRALALSPDDLRSMELVRTDGDFSCVEGWTASDLSWRGVPVTDVLDRAGPGEDAKYALVRAMDDEYACSFPLERLGGALLALELDGDALPVEHGGPARLVPAMSESDCWESVKWVSEIELFPDEPDDTAKSLALDRTE